MNSSILNLILPARDIFLLYLIFFLLYEIVLFLNGYNNCSFILHAPYFNFLHEKVVHLLIMSIVLIVDWLIQLQLGNFKNLFMEPSSSSSTIAACMQRFRKERPLSRIERSAIPSPFWWQKGDNELNPSQEDDWYSALKLKYSSSSQLNSNAQLQHNNDMQDNDMHHDHVEDTEDIMDRLRLRYGLSKKRESRSISTQTKKEERINTISISCQTKKTVPEKTNKSIQVTPERCEKGTDSLTVQERCEPLFAHCMSNWIGNNQQVTRPSYTALAETYAADPIVAKLQLQLKTLSNTNAAEGCK